MNSIYPPGRLPPPCDFSAPRSTIIDFKSPGPRVASTPLQTLPHDISISVRIPPHIIIDLVPRLYLCGLSYVKLNCQAEINNLDLHRTLVLHVLRGLRGEPHVNQLKRDQFEAENIRLMQMVIAINVFSVETMIRDAWAFVIGVRAGEDREEMWVETWQQEFMEGYLCGIGNGEGLNVLRELIKGIGGWGKCLGVVGRGCVREEVVATVGHMVWRETSGKVAVGEETLSMGGVRDMEQSEWEHIVSVWGSKFELQGGDVSKLVSQWQSVKRREGTHKKDILDRENFEREWEAVQGCDELKRFVGGLALLDRVRVEEGGQQSNWNHSLGWEDAEFVRHARQYVIMKSIA